MALVVPRTALESSLTLAFYDVFTTKNYLGCVMNQITNSLPSWARTKVAQFLSDKTSPLEGAPQYDVSEKDAKAFQDLIFLQADNLTADDQKGADLDKRPGHIQKSVFNTGVTEDIHYRREGQQLEIAYDMGDGHHAQYLLNDDDKAVYVDMVRSSGHSHDMAVFVDKKNPANSVLFAKED